MGSPFLQYDKLLALSIQGGYIQSPALNQLSAIFLLSACESLRQKWWWQSPSEQIDDAEYNLINDMIDECVEQLMVNINIGSIVPSVALVADTNWVVMIGQLLPVADYTELASVVPPAWIVGTDIQLPDMTAKALFGALNLATVGVVAGENFVTLTEAEMPSHNHTQNPHSHSEVIPTVTPTGAGPIVAGASLVLPTPSVTGATVAGNNPTGGDGSHLNVPESLLLVWYIVAR